MIETTVTIGPVVPKDYVWAEGDCAWCGGDCDGGDCGLHSAGCVFGGTGTGYWLITAGCPLDHGDRS